MVNYIVKDKTIIFSPYFNKKIESGLLVQYSNVIFSDYELNDKLFECYEKNDFKNFKFAYSRFDQQVNLPHNLTHLTFGFDFNQPVNLHPKGCSSNITAGCCSCCPSNLTHLTFGRSFNQQVELPPNLTHLTFGFKFNQQVNLPLNLTHLTFGKRFNQQVNLPLNLTHLTFGGDFNQQVNLPLNLTHLTFGTEFNQQVNLPLNLTHLTFGTEFNQQVNLPEKITHLTFGWYFNQQVNLPEKITHLIFGNWFDREVNLPLNVRYLKIDCDNANIIDYLPDSVEELILGYNFNLELNNLPSSIKKLVIKNDRYVNELNCLPYNLEYLQLPPGYDKEIKKYPKKLKTIKCHCNYKYIDKVNVFEIELYD